MKRDAERVREVPPRWSPRPIPSLALSLLFLGCTGLQAGCRAIQAVADTPGNITRAVLPGAEGPGTTPISEMHPELLRVSDFTIQRFRFAATRFLREADTNQAKIQAVEWRFRATSAVLEAATGPNPTAGMLDLLTVVKSAGLLAQQLVDSREWGEAGVPFVSASKASEKRIWQVMGAFFTEEELVAFHAAFGAWEGDELGVKGRFVEDPPTFRDILAALDESSQTKKGLLGIVRLDPFAGLEPVAREVALARRFAERTLFWSQRLPLIVDDQVALGTLRAQELPEVEQLMADVELVSLAIDSVAKTAAALPEQIRTERDAAVSQMSSELEALTKATLEEASKEITAQREGLVRDLDTAQEPLSHLLGESRATLESARTMTFELNALVAAVDAFVGRFDAIVGERRPPATAQPAGAEGAAQPSRPFDITDYGDTAERLASTAVELRELVTTLDESFPEVERVIEAAASRGDETVDRVFRRGLQLGLSLIAAAVLAVITVRFVRPRAQD